MRSSFRAGTVEAAIDRLLDAYSRYAGQRAVEWCDSAGIAIRRTVDRPFTAYLCRSVGDQEPRWIIRLPKRELRDIVRDFFIFHELAHVFLIGGGCILPMSVEQYWEMECWCDNFSALMLLGSLGYRIPNDEARTFLGEVTWETGACAMNRWAAARIACLCRASSAIDEAGAAPLKELISELTEEK